MASMATLHASVSMKNSQAESRYTEIGAVVKLIELFEGLGNLK